MTKIEQLTAQRDDLIARASAIEATARAEALELGPEETEEIDQALRAMEAA